LPHNEKNSTKLDGKPELSNRFGGLSVRSMDRQRLSDSNSLL
jgi:hypothetical protein